MSLARSQATNNDEYRDPDQLYDSLKENNVKVYEGTMAILMGEILLCKDDHPVKETEDWIHLAMKIHKSDGMMWHFARDLVVYADFLKSVDDTLKAYENLNMAKEIFTQCGADGWSDMVKQLLLDSENIITMKGGEKKAGEIDINDNKKSNQ
jgi:hypothetical protein